MGCPNCIKEGLAILPVRYAVAPASVTNVGALPSPLGEHVTDKPLKASRYILRQLDRGFVYVLYPNRGTRQSRWVVYEVGPDACMNIYADPRQVPSAPTEKPLDATCKAKKEDFAAQTIAIPSPQYVPHVWVAFSRYRLTDRVLTALETSPEPRMQKVDVQKAINGKEVKHALPATQNNLINYVADFSAPEGWNKLNGSGKLTVQLNQRHDQAAAMQTRMAEIAQKANGKGIVLALFDPIGMTADLNAFRNQEVGQLAAYQAGHARERFVGDTILGFKTVFEKKGESAQWEEKFLKLYDAKRLDDDQQARKKETDTRNTQIDLLSDDVAKWNGNSNADLRWQDFDLKDMKSSQDRQTAFALCVHGMGKTKAELDLWDVWFAANAKDPYTPLWGALVGSAPGLARHLTGTGLPDIGRLDKMNDTVKGFIAIREEYKAWLEKNPPSAALGTIAVAASAQFPRLAKVNPALYQKAGYFILVIVSATTKTVVSGNTVVVNKTSELVAMMFRGVWPPKGSPLKMVKADSAATKTVYVATAEGVAQIVEEQTIVSKTAIGMWMPAEAIEGTPVKGVSQVPLALPAPEKFNAFERLIGFAKNGLPWVGFALASINLAGISMSMGSAQPGANTPDVYAGLVSGMLAVIGAIGELTALGMEKAAVGLAKTAAAKVAFGGGLFAAVSTFAESVQIYFKYVDRKSVGNDEAAKNYRRSSTAFFFAAVTSAGGALAAGSAADAFTGILAFLAPVGAAAATIPMIGWIAAGVIFIGMGVWFAWQAIVATNSPLQDWVAMSYYGKAPKRYRDPRAEMAALRDVMYAYRLETDWSGLQMNRAIVGVTGYDSVSFSLSLPGASTSSVIKCAISLADSNSNKTILNEEVHPASYLPGELSDPHMQEMRPMPTASKSPMSFYWEAPPRLVKSPSGGYEYKGVLRVDHRQYSVATINLQYFPDPAQPDLVIPTDGKPVLVERGIGADILSGLLSY